MAKKKMQFEIPCPHDAGQADKDETVPDHHPLDKEEIVRLLKLAKQNRRHAVMVSKIQVRLNQGIVGLTCPRSIEGKVAEKEAELNELFVKKFRKGADPELVDQLYQIMTS